MQHIRQTIKELRRYIAMSDDREDLEEVDALLAVAHEEVRKRIGKRQSPWQDALPPK